MKYPCMSIDVEKIRHNAVTVSRLLAASGLRFVAVNKATCGHPEVARAMLEGDPLAVADSRIENLRRLRESGYKGETVLLRAPSPSRCAEAVEVVDTSLVSEVAIAAALGEAARARGKEHKVILMVDLGDRREGVLPEDTPDVARAVASILGVRLAGIGTNLACYGAVIPTREKMEELLEVKEKVEEAVGFPLERVSGGNSANIPLVLRGEMPRGITELRLGESVILGTEAAERTLIPGCFGDAFTLHAEAIEVITKPSMPSGKIGQDAFGEVPVFVDRGNRKRAILAIGRQDVDPDGLTPIDKGVTVLGASSDHLICDVEDAEEDVKVGSVLSFVPNYSALLRLATSPYVEKVVKKP